MTSIELQAGSVEAAINAVEAAGALLRHAVATLDEVEAERADQKLRAMGRLTAMENPATPGKNFTASAAADFAQFDEGYAVYTERRALAAQWVAAREQDREIAKLRAEWAVVLFKAGAGVEA